MDEGVTASHLFYLARCKNSLDVVCRVYKQVNLSATLVGASRHVYVSIELLPLLSSVVRHLLLYYTLRYLPGPLQLQYKVHVSSHVIKCQARTYMYLVLEVVLGQELGVLQGSSLCLILETITVEGSPSTGATDM